MRVSLNWAHQDGVDFFFFDWFWYSQQPGPDQQRSPHLNNALANYMKLRDHDGVGAALMYINIVGTCLDEVGWDYFAQLIHGETWDALTQGADPNAACPRDGAQPYPDLVAAGEQAWDYYAQRLGEFPTIPTIQGGWDGRPADESQLGHLWWFERTPDEFGGFVRDAISWANEHPEQMVEPPPARPIVMVWAWNELQEGEQLMPTVGDGYGYGQALAEAIGLPRPAPTRDTLSITTNRGGVIKGLPPAANCSARCRTAVDYGWQVILTAIPRHGYTFRSWSGGCRGRARSCSCIIEHDTSVRATFKRSK